MCRTACPWGQGNGRGSHLKKGGEGFLLSFSCVTSIKTQKYSTRTNRHKSAALYLQLRLAPAHLASRLQDGVGEGVSHTSRERNRGRRGQKEKRGRGGGDHRETKRNKVKLQETAARRGTLGTLLLPLPTKDSESKAKEDGCRERGEIEAHRTWEESGRGSPGGRNGTKCHPKSPTPLCHFPLSCQHIWFPQMPLPHKPPPTPSTPPLDPGHPNTGGKEIFRRLSYLQYRPSPSPSPSLYRDR